MIIYYPEGTNDLEKHKLKKILEKNKKYLTKNGKNLTIIEKDCRVSFSKYEDIINVIDFKFN